MVSRFLFYCFCVLLALHSFPTRRSSDLAIRDLAGPSLPGHAGGAAGAPVRQRPGAGRAAGGARRRERRVLSRADRKSTRLNSSHVKTSYAVFCLKKKMAFSMLSMVGTPQ